jgi:UDP-N-acetylglucosamine 2-epimerase (non-hydrolysing)
MRDGQSPSDIAGCILHKLPPVLAHVQPDVLLVQGDTITTFAASLAAFLNRIPVGHIEAGLRTGNLNHPFPEEMNRRLTSKIAGLHFAPTPVARQALRDEGVPNADIYVTGNTVIDALLATVNPDHRFCARELQELTEGRPLILVTVHRRESFGRPLENICQAVASIANARRSHHIVLPVHPNPNVRKTVHHILGLIPNVTLCAPLEYRDFVNLMGRSKIILTDSGGIQEEAPSLNIPVLVLRETTERPEGIHAGAARLVGTDYRGIVSAATELLNDEHLYDQMAKADNPYGDGTAAKQIADVLAQRFSPA